MPAAMLLVPFQKGEGVLVAGKEVSPGGKAVSLPGRIAQFSCLSMLDGYCMRSVSKGKVRHAEGVSKRLV